jgi:RNA polymerase sigma-70 factor (ECF subfamily)
VSELILQRVASGESAAVDECLARYGGLVWSIARRFSSNKTDAEDAVQEIFVEVWRKAGRYDETVASEAAFIAMIARRRLIDRLRRGRTRPDTEHLRDELPSSEASASDRVEICDEAARAKEYLATLKSDERKLLELSVFSGLSHAQIADTTGLPLGTVKTRVRRGLTRLRELLSVDYAKNVPGGAT